MSAQCQGAAGILPESVIAPADTLLLPACYCEPLCCHANACQVFACHCEPVRTLVWQSASPQKCLASWQLFGQIRYALRICPKYCFSLCATARRTDCHVAPLLAMTCRNMRLSAVATAWCQANLSRFRIRPRRYFLLCPAAGEADCHVASLLAMTCCNLQPVSVCKNLLPVENPHHLPFRLKYCSLLCTSAEKRIAASLRSSQ